METNTPDLKHSTAALRPHLNRWEVRFCQLLVEGNSQYEAYTQAGFPEKRSRNATEQAAVRLVKRVEIRAYLRLLIREALDAQVTTNRVVQALARQAFADRRRLYDDKGCLLPPDRWPEDVAAAVESIETIEVFEDAPPARGELPTEVLRGHVRKVRMSRRGEALRQLAQYLRLGTAPAEPVPGPLVVIGGADPGELPPAGL